jgi:L-asparaginase/Glu-tRNA(Gln) amidotransferase subunit D
LNRRKPGTTEQARKKGVTVMQHCKARKIALIVGMTVGFFNFVSTFSEVMSADVPKPKIMFITTGGTIAHRENPDGSNSRIELPEVITNIRARYPQPDVLALFDSIKPSFKEVTLVGSSSLRLQDFLNIAWETQKALDQDFDAAIVTHGTTTSEDTCYFLNLLVNSRKPIVLTNSQRQRLERTPDQIRGIERLERLEQIQFTLNT